VARQRSHSPRPEVADSFGGVEGNARLTGSLGALLFALLAAEGVTILAIGRLLTPHVFIGLLLIPPTLVKIAATGWRFLRYYSGDPRYARRGPPPTALRLIGPVVVVLTLVVLGSGVALVVVPTSERALLLQLHQASFLLWFGATAIHVLGHVLDTASLAPRDWVARTRRQVRGATTRQWVVVWSLVAGVVTAVAVTPLSYGWFNSL